MGASKASFERPIFFQFTNRRGAILHVTPEYPLVSKTFGHLGRIVQKVVEHQREAGFNVQVVVPGSPEINPSAKEINYIQVIGELSAQYPLGEDAFDQMASFSRNFWKFVEIAPFPIAVIHTHDAMGLALGFRPEKLTRIRSIYSIYGPQDPSPLDYSVPAANPDPEISMGITHHGRDSALKAGVYGAHHSIFWSEPHLSTLMRGLYQYFIRLEQERGVRFVILPGNFRPVDSPTPPPSAIYRLNRLYHEIIFGESGIEFANRAIGEPWVPIKTMLYICNETVSVLPGRTQRALAAFKSDNKIRDGISEIIGYGRGLHPEFNPNYRGALGTFVFLIAEGAKRIAPDSPIFIGINASGIAQRETPLTQQEKGDKGAAMLGNRTLNQIVTVGCELIAKQLPPGEWIIVAASDNAFAGRITVGDHLLSEDKHGIINLTIPERVLGEGITPGDERLKPLEQLGILLINPKTGAVIEFREKASVIAIQNLAKISGGIVDANSMVKLIRRDIAELYNDGEHYLRPSYKDGDPFLFAYADKIPDWSKFHDEPIVHSTTLEKWMGKYKEGSGYDRRDWRLFWIIANDLILSSLERIALKEEYFGGLASHTLNWEDIRNASLEILKQNGGFVPSSDPAPDINDMWYFKRCQDAKLEANWKELFLASMAIKYKFAEKAKDEWMKRKPASLGYDDWKTIWEISLDLDEKENGLAAGRIDGFWLDTGTKREFFNAWLKLIDENPVNRATIRRLCDVRPGGAVEAEVRNQELLVIPNRDSVHIGGKTTFVSLKGGKIHIGNNVVIRDSEIVWSGEGDLYIPSNTVIYDSRLEDIDPTIREDGATLIYRFNGRSGQTFEIDTPSGKKKIRFGFYGGVMLGTMILNNGEEVSTLFPLDLNLKDPPDLSLIDKYITNPDLQHHFRGYYGDGVEVIKKPLPFTDMLAKDILSLIGF